MHHPETHVGVTPLPCPLTFCSCAQPPTTNSVLDDCTCHAQVLHDVRVERHGTSYLLADNKRWSACAPGPGLLREGLQLVRPGCQGGRPVVKMALLTAADGARMGPQQQPKLLMTEWGLRRLQKPAMVALFGWGAVKPGFKTAADLQVQVDGVLMNRVGCA